jgi:uncharacterized membrane protein YfcA
MIESQSFVMIHTSIATVLATLALGTVAGATGTLLGLGGGVFLVPFLVLIVGLPFHQAAAISLVTVIATSSAVSAARAGRNLINLRFGMVLEVATAVGGLAGGLTAQMLAASTLQRLFGISSLAVGAITVLRMRRPSDPPDVVDPGVLGGRYLDEYLGHEVTYRPKHLHIALGASFVAGNVSTLLGLGGGFIKVPVLAAWCGVPLRAAAATSAFMIGVTATSGAVVYYGTGAIVPELAAAAVVGVQVGSAAGLHVSARFDSRWLEALLATVLVAVGTLMLWRAS